MMLTDEDAPDSGAGLSQAGVAAAGTGSVSPPTVAVAPVRGAIASNGRNDNGIFSRLKKGK